MSNTMTVTEAAAALEVSRQTVIRLYHDGKLTGYRTTDAKGAHIRLFAADVVDFRNNVQMRQPQPAKIA